MDAIAEVSRRTLAKVLVGFWTAYTILFLVRAYMEPWASRFASLARRVPMAIFGALLCLAMAEILRRADPRGIRDRILWVVGLSVPAGVGFAIVNSAALYFIAPISGEDCRDGFKCSVEGVFVLAVEYSVNFIFVFAAWALLYLGMRDSQKAVAAERAAGREREAARLAELRALRYQVNPHFLFNSLNSLGTLVDRGESETARDMIGEMSAFLRYGFAADPVADVELEEEVEMERQYLAIECRRFGHRLQAVFDIPDEVRRARVPALILQPLVENAIKHGLARTSAPVVITITATRVGAGLLRLKVEDDAPQKPKDVTACGIGLRNVEERLSARFGSAGRIEAGSTGSSFAVTLTMPLELA
ncbi:sensor histidine kinase [Sphingopyxis sp.]|jgi:two-component system LytT family sensor kinase|uniref:sensor histidine kinase n=1 Tax=Sphingopyxis sp. TaxID=1908224 RepID=UPI003F70DE8B